MSLWLVLALVAVWFAVAGMVVALCVMAGRSDRREAAFRRMRRTSLEPQPRTDGRRRRRRAADAARDQQDATG